MDSSAGCSSGFVEFDCESRCRSSQHAAELISSVTKGTPSQVVAFLSRCHNVEHVTDSLGRSVLHVAASCGKQVVVEWLVERGASVNSADKESGWTALHRAVFYGQLEVARFLISNGSNIYQKDMEGLSPLDLAMKDRLPHVEFVNSGLSEVFTWGINSNSTLGHHSLQRKKTPERIEFFRKSGISIKSVVLGKYHSVFLANSGSVYTCGHSLGGRLGHRHKICLVPELVDGLAGESCVQVAVSRNHTVMLMESGKVYSCGLNTHAQLGYSSTTDMTDLPRMINLKVLKGLEVVGVAAARYHTVLYTKDIIYTFGLNAGQLGHAKQPNEVIVSAPRPVTALIYKETSIRQLVSSDAAIVVLTSRGDVFVLHEYSCTRIIAKWLNIGKIGVVGGTLDASVIAGESDRMNESSIKSSSGHCPLTVIILTSYGQLYAWRESDPVPRRCIWSIRRPIKITQFSLSHSGVVGFVSKEGEAFTAQLPQQLSNNMLQISSTTTLKSSASFSKNKDLQLLDYSPTLNDLVSKDDVIQLKVIRISLVHQATAIFVDQLGLNFALLQAHPNACVTSIPCVGDSLMTRHLMTLLNEAWLNDGITDVTLQVGSEKIPAHSYVLATRSEYFQTRLTSSTWSEQLSSKSRTTSLVVLKIDLPRDVTMTLFRQLLQFIYTDSCDALHIGTKAEQLIGTRMDKINSNSDVNNRGSKKSNGVKSDDRKRKSDKMISAYQVARNSKAGAGGETEVISEQCGDPVKLLQDLAREFGVKSLVKYLESMYCLDGYVAMKKERNISRPPLKFNRNDTLCDVFIESEDGVSFSCHMCILVARSEYFNSMLLSGWFEASNTSGLRLSIPGSILDVILDFLYTDESPRVSHCDDVDFLCNVLAVADQLLLGRLKEISEVALAQHLTLRNSCDLLEFSTMCGATQLKLTCHQFITINMAALLETRSLDRLSDDVMNELTSYYKDSIPGMTCRIITPYSGWPDSLTLETLGLRTVSAMVPSSRGHRGKKKKKTGKKGSGNSIEEEVTMELDNSSIQVHNINAVEKCGNDRLLTNVDPLLDTVQSEKPKETFHPAEPAVTNWWLNRAICKSSLISSPKVLCDSQVSAIKDGSSDSLLNTGTLQTSRASEPNLTSYKTSSAQQSLSNLGNTVPKLTADTASVIQGKTETVGDSGVKPNVLVLKTLREIMDEEAAAASQRGAMSAVVKLAPAAKRGAKVSKANRKKLSETQDGSTAVTCRDIGGTSPTVCDPDTSRLQNPWKQVDRVVESFKDLMLCDIKRVESDSSRAHSKPIPIRSTPLAVVTPTSPLLHISASSLGFATSPTDGSFRWGLTSSVRSLHGAISPGVSASASPPALAEYEWMRSPSMDTVHFSDVLNEELRQRETWLRAKNKPLSFIQKEEEAMRSLLVHYKAFDNTNEYITVERVHSSYDRPLWAATQRQQKQQ